MSRARNHVLAAGFVVAVAGAARAADDVVTIRTIGSAADEMQQGFAYGGDLDGDGAPDLVVEVSGGVRAFSFRSGAAIRDYTAEGHPGFLGRSLAFLPDIDGDGVAEVLAGAPGVGHLLGAPGAAIVFSGGKGTELRRGASLSSQARFGSQVVALGDVTGDGTPDFAAGGYGSFGATPGEIRAFSGADGSVIPWLDKAGTGTDNFGFSMVAVGDVNGDGVPDLVVGSPGANNPEGAPPPVGRIDVLSGKDGRVLRRINGKTPYLGYSLVNVGDVDGDGAADVAAGGTQSGYVTVYSVRTGRTLRRLLRPSGDTGNYFGDTLAAGADADGDGRADLAAIQNTPQGPIFYVYGTASLGLAPLDRFQPAPPLFVGRIALVPDQDADGIADLAVLVQGDAVRILKVTPDLAPAFRFAAALTRPQSGAALAARGTFSVKVSKSGQSVAVVCKGLAAGGTYSVHLEDGPDSGEFDLVGTLALKGTAGGLTVTGTGAPPDALGIRSLAQIAGRRVQLRDGAGAVILEAVLPLPGPLASSSAKIPLLRHPATTFTSAAASLSLKYAAKTGSILFSLVVKGVPAGTPLALQIEDAPGSGAFVDAGPFTGSKYARDTKLGQPLPGGAAGYAGISGRAIRVVSGAQVVLVGLLP